MSIEIDKISDEVVEITLNGWIYSIDDSTGEKIVERWPANDDESSDMERDNYMSTGTMSPKKMSPSSSPKRRRVLGGL